jgi:hypothetical protein
VYLVSQIFLGNKSHGFANPFVLFVPEKRIGVQPHKLNIHRPSPLEEPNFMRHLDIVDLGDAGMV